MGEGGGISKYVYYRENDFYNFFFKWSSAGVQADLWNPECGEASAPPPRLHSLHGETCKATRKTIAWF